MSIEERIGTDRQSCPYLDRALESRDRSLARFSENPDLARALASDFNEPFIAYWVRNVETRILFDPALIRHCFGENAGNYAHTKIHQRLLRPVMGEGLIVANGEIWKRTRLALQGAFSPANLSTYCERTFAVAKDFFEKNPPEPGVVELSDFMSVVTFRVLSEALFSGDLREREDELLVAIAEIIDSLEGPDRVGPVLAPFFFPSASKIARSSAVASCRAIVSKIVKERLLRPVADRDDIFSRMVALADCEFSGEERLRFLIDNVTTFLFSGHVTTATALSWTLFLLSGSKKDLERARREVDDLFSGDLPASRWHESAPILHACFEESMRLYPPVPLLTRQAVNDDFSGPIFFPAGTNVIVATSLLHRMHRFWDKPSEFVPDRFLRRGQRPIDKFAYLPFGVGPRTCIGAQLATRESIILLAFFLHHLDFEYAAPEAPQPMMRVVTRPENRIPMRIFRRR